MSWKRLNGPTFLPSLGILLLEEETGFLILVCVCVGGVFSSGPAVGSLCTPRSSTGERKHWSRDRAKAFPLQHS